MILQDRNEHECYYLYNCQGGFFSTRAKFFMNMLRTCIKQSLTIILMCFIGRQVDDTETYDNTALSQIDTKLNSEVKFAPQTEV